MWKIIVGVVIILLGASIAYSQYVGKQADEGVSIEDKVKGNPDAEIVLVEYSDFQCPACAQFYPYVKEILEEHGDSLRFEYRHFPLINIHPHAVPAARAAEAAGQQGEFFAMHDKLFENQSAWSNSAAPTVHFEEYAEELGLDIDLYKRHINSSLIASAIQDDFNEAREQGYSSTPTFLLNGEVMQFQTFDSFIEQIEAAIGVEP
ncbi:MAG: thioredoxin domain-containing protein, partial [Candidatus Paceibacterota bacterium]